VDADRQVALITTGGTIESAAASRVDHAWYHEAGQRLEPGRLMEAVPELADVARVVEHPFRRLSSSAVTPADWLGLGRTAASILSQVDGVVITHGTDTLEETAYFLHLTLTVTRPVVLVGAMRPPATLGTDAHLNLVRAVQVAASDAARGQGVLVVANDTIFAARDVTKARTYRVDAFSAGDLGPLGHADADGRVVLYHRHRRAAHPPFDLAGIAEVPRVDVVVSYVGADGALIDAAAAAGAAGIVSAGTGAGRCTPGEEAAFARAAAQGVVVCHASRVGAGRVARSPARAAAGRVVADNLQAWKAKVLLALALTRTSDPDEIQGLFDLH
jgi:L-asparaginase